MISIKKNKWNLVARAPDMNAIDSKCVYRTKLKSSGSIELLKARLIVEGYSQISGFDFDETF